MKKEERVWVLLKREWARSEAYWPISGRNSSIVTACRLMSS